MTTENIAAIIAFAVCGIATFAVSTFYLNSSGRAKPATLQIRDARTSQPIPNATVILGGSNPATFGADQHGTVSINFQGKTQWLTVTAKGYKDTKYRLAGSGRIALFIHPDEGPAEAIPCWDLE